MEDLDGYGRSYTRLHFLPMVQQDGRILQLHKCLRAPISSDAGAAAKYRPLD